MPDWLKLTLILFVFSLVFVRVYNKNYFFFYPDNGDDAGYYIYTEAFFKTHTFKFCDPAFSIRLNAGKDCLAGIDVPYNKYSPGPALLLSPFSAMGRALELSGLFTPAGASLMFWSVVGTFFLFLGGSLLWLACAVEITRKKKESFWITLCFLTGNIILFYVFRRPFMAHASEFFLMAAGFYLVSRLVNETNQILRLSTLLGLVAGLLAIVRYNDFPISIFFFLSVFFCLKKKSQRYQRPLLAFLIASAAPVTYFLTTYFVQKHTILYKPSEYDNLTGFFLLYRFRWSNLRRAFDLFLGPNWGVYWLFPFFFIELWVIAKNRRLIQTWVKQNLFWFYSTLFLCFLSLNIVVNFDGSGMSYANRYFLPITYFMHLFFLMALRYQKGPLFRTRTVKAAAVVAVILGALNVINFESNTSTLALTEGPLIDDGIYEPPRRDVVELRGNKFALHSLVYSLTGRAVQNLGASPFVTYPLLTFAPTFRKFSVTRKALDYYESPKRQIMGVGDLKYLWQYHFALLFLLLSFLSLALQRLRLRT